MKKTSIYNNKKALIIIGGNARIVQSISLELEESNNYEETTLISTRDSSRKLNASYKEIRCTSRTLNSSIIKSIRKDRMNSLLFANIPSRNVFETIENPTYLDNYKLLYSRIHKKKNIEKIVFLGSATGAYYNFFNRRYNSYRLAEIRNFEKLWAKSVLPATILLLPPLDTSNSLIGKIMFAEKRTIWAKKIVAILLSKSQSRPYEYPYKTISKIVVFLFIILRLKSLI